MPTHYTLYIIHSRNIFSYFTLIINGLRFIYWVFEDLFWQMDDFGRFVRRWLKATFLTQCVLKEDKAPPMLSSTLCHFIFILRSRASLTKSGRQAAPGGQRSVIFGLRTKTQRACRVVLQPDLSDRDNQPRRARNHIPASCGFNRPNIRLPFIVGTPSEQNLTNRPANRNREAWLKRSKLHPVVYPQSRSQNGANWHFRTRKPSQNWFASQKWPKRKRVKFSTLSRSSGGYSNKGRM